MTVYAVSTTGKNAPMVTGFSSEKEARNSGNGFNLVSSPTDLRKSIFKTSDLVDIYNLNSERKIQKFRDRSTAEKRVWESFSSIEISNFLTVEEAQDTGLIGDIKVEKPKGRPQSTYGKDTSFTAPDRLSTNKMSLKYNNPRRKGTHGWKFMGLILKNPGITLEQIQKFYKPTGEKFMHHLKWDVEHGNILVAPNKGK